MRHTLTLVLLVCALGTVSCWAAELGTIQRVPVTAGQILLPTGGPAPADLAQIQPGTNGVFLRIVGIPGDSNSPTFKDWIDGSSWEYAVTQTVYREGAGGAGAARPQGGPLVVVKRVDSATPKLFQVCASGQHIPEAELVIVSGGKAQLHITLQSVLIVRTGRLLADGDGGGMERVALTAARVKWGVPTYSQTGKYTGEMALGWDFSQGTTW